MMETVKFTVDKKGNVQISAEGFQGQVCTLTTKKIEELLGVSVDRELKSEFYMAEVDTQQTIKNA